MISGKGVKTEVPDSLNTSTLLSTRSSTSPLSSLAGSPTLVSSNEPLVAGQTLDSADFSTLLRTKHPNQILEMLEIKLSEATDCIDEIEERSHVLEHRYAHNVRRDRYTTLEVQADREESARLKQRWVELNCEIEMLQSMGKKVLTELQRGLLQGQVPKVEESVPKVERLLLKVEGPGPNVKEEKMAD